MRFALLEECLLERLKESSLIAREFVDEFARRTVQKSPVPGETNDALGRAMVPALLNEVVVGLFWGGNGRFRIEA